MLQHIIFTLFLFYLYKSAKNLANLQKSYPYKYPHIGIIIYFIKIIIFIFIKTQKILPKLKSFEGFFILDLMAEF